jgi:antitoxin VapB
MSLNTKSEEAERPARELAGATGESLTRAVAVALRERLDRVHREDETEMAARAARIRRIAEDAASRWLDELRAADHGDLLTTKTDCQGDRRHLCSRRAILRGEPEADIFVTALSRAGDPKLSAG